LSSVEALPSVFYLALGKEADSGSETPLKFNLVHASTWIREHAGIIMDRKRIVLQIANNVY
jgi:hypothetical protein